MTSKKILHKNYTTNGNVVQLKLPFDIEVLIPEDDSVRLLSQFVEEMDLTNLYKTYSRIRENHATPMELLKIVIYGYMNGLYSSRPLETACKRDVNFMYLLDGKKAPDHTTIARFKSLHFALVAKEILAEVTDNLFELGEISGETIFIDGTKIEANANKYTFVWKKSTTKHMQKKLQKVADFVAECEELYGIKLIYKDIVKIKHLKKLRKQLYRIKNEENIEFVKGKGKRKTQLQRSIEELEGYLEKLKEYTKKLYIAGDRSSYSKTDEDATFMRMKEDHMRNGQLKPAYNVQHGVDAEYITWVTIEQVTNDVKTLKPFLQEMEDYLSFKYKKIVADSGYESEENYAFIEENNQLSFIKPANYEISKTKKYKNDISRVENMDYDEDSDTYLCKNNKKLIATKVFIRKSRTGYKSQKTEYICEDCSDCPYKSDCMRGNHWKTPLEERTKRLEISKEFKRYRKEDLERILSDTGIELRTNRSIQAEGSFAQIKQDMGFRRFLSRGKQNVLTESILLAIGHNINKLHRKIQNARLGKHLFKVKESA
jgi:transposase